MKTKHGQSLALTLWQAGLEWEGENNHKVVDTLSLIGRHSATYVRLHEWLAGGHPTFGGDYINKNQTKLDAQDERLEARLATLGATLAGLVSAGSPRLTTHSLYGVRVTVTDRHGIERTREMTK